jgi:hypothetical protein
VGEGIRRERATLLWISGGATLVAASVFFLTFRDWQAREQTLADGTVVRFEGLTFGSSHSFSTSGFKEKIRRWLPTSLRPLLGAPGLSAQIQSAPDSLVIWTTRVDPAAAMLAAPRNEPHYVTDAHGCRFRSQHWVSTRASGKQLMGAAFEAFPRGERSFAYLICDKSGNVLGQLTISNPYQTNPQRWSPEPVPMTKTNEGLAVEFRGFGRADSIDPLAMRPQVSLVRPRDSELWRKGPVWIYGRFGNRGFGALCTNEPVWKIEAHFFRKAHAEFRAEETWSITNVAIPPPGGVTRLQTTNTLQGCTVIVEALKGADPLEVSIPASTPTLLLRNSNSYDEAKILVRACDNEGRKLITRHDNFHPTYRGNVGVHIHPLPDSKSLDIEVLVQQPRKFEFFVEPPK